MKCPRCGCENPDDYKFCHECGTYLSPKFDAYNASNYNLIYTDDLEGIDSRKLIVVGYIIVILFGWGGLILSLIFKSFIGFAAFVGFFFPGFMLNSENKTIRKHTYIQMAIMLVGFLLTLYVIFAH